MWLDVLINVGGPVAVLLYLIRMTLIDPSADDAEQGD